jgi:hypothetical protein
MIENLPIPKTLFRPSPRLQSRSGMWSVGRPAAWVVVTAGLLTLLVSVQDAFAAQPNPILNSVFPPGGQAGSSVEVTVAGSALTKVVELRCSHPKITCETENGKQFRLTIPADIPNGHYDLCALTANGLSSVRSFIVGSLPEQSEAIPNDSLATAESISMDTVTNGRIEKAGDVDHFSFEAKRGQRVVIECQAERIDSSLRAVLEVFNAAGRRLAVNRGFFGIDPLISFDVPDDGVYRVRIFDLVYSGGADHVYRLSISTGPRVVFSMPAFVQSGTTSEVKLFGWNLSGSAASSDDLRYETVDVEITPPVLSEPVSPLRLTPTQVETSGFAYHYAGTQTPVRIGLSDVPVTRTPSDNHSPSAAQPITVPAEVSGQLAVTGELDWFRFDAKRGEVFWFEAFGERIGAPLDLDVSVLDDSAEHELARFSDRTQNVGGTRFPSAHSDPSGRWVVPADGQYLILVRSLTGGTEGGTDVDPRRVYRLSVRREEPDFDLAVVPRRDDPTALNVPRGGRAIVDVLAFRRRGLTGTIRVFARDLPAGLECPDVWLGPGVSRVPLVVTAAEQAESLTGELQLEGRSDLAGSKSVQGSTVVRKGLPTGWSRLTDQIGLSIVGEAPIRITADGHEKREHDLFGDLDVRHSPGSLLDIAVQVERREIDYQAPVTLSGVGLPDLIQNQKATIAAGQATGHISFYLPPTISAGRYTIVVQGQTTVPLGAVDAKGQRKTETVTVFTNPVTFEVEPAAFIVELDQDAPQRIRRGEVLQVKYSARRVNGFISKIHTELFAPGGVRGIRGRGVTFVGQTETGNIQIIANNDAPLGQQPFLRLYAVGVLEDEPVYHGSCFLPLEIVE